MTVQDLRAGGAGAFRYAVHPPESATSDVGGVSSIHAPARDLASGTRARGRRTSERLNWCGSKAVNAKEVRICGLEREQKRRTLTSSVRCLFAGDAPFKAVSKFEFEACGFSMFASCERERARRRLVEINAAGPAS
jgi:hypothetical protein